MLFIKKKKLNKKFDVASLAFSNRRRHFLCLINVRYKKIAVIPQPLFKSVKQIIQKLV